MGTYSFGPRPVKAKMFRGAELCSHRGVTRKSGGLAGVVGGAPNEHHSEGKRGNVRF